MIYRTARHTNDLKPIIDFYTKIIGLKVLGSFENHNDYNGVFIGKPDHTWHLEFTTSKLKANHKFDNDDILVFYPTEREEYDMILKHIDMYEIEYIDPENPYWKTNGVMIKDPDGYRIVISNLRFE